MRLQVCLIDCLFVCLIACLLVCLLSVFYHCKFVRLRYTQNCTHRNMNPRYSHNLHWCHSYECESYTHPGLQQLNQRFDMWSTSKTLPCLNKHFLELFYSQLLLSTSKLLSTLSFRIKVYINEHTRKYPKLNSLFSKPI